MGWSIGGRHTSFVLQDTRLGGALLRFQKRRRGVGWVVNWRAEYGFAAKFPILRFKDKLVSLKIARECLCSTLLRVTGLQGAELDARSRASYLV